MRLANCCQQPTAARLPLSGLKPLFSPETNDVTPLADRVSLLQLNRGKRAAVRTARTRGLAAAEATNVSQTGGRGAQPLQHFRGTQPLR